MAAAYVALALTEVLVHGDHPASPSVIAPAASALSIALVSLMAHQAMLATGPLVGLASLVSATHAWAFACLAVDHDGARAFALTVLGGALVVGRARELGVLVAAVGLSFVSALGASAIDRPVHAALELLAASSLALALVTASEARARRSELRAAVA